MRLGFAGLRLPIGFRLVTVFYCSGSVDKERGLRHTEIPKLTYSRYYAFSFQ